MGNQHGRLILVSNRLPVTCVKLKTKGFKLNTSSGGLVAGLREIHQADEVLWVGHAGINPSEEDFTVLKNQLEKERLIPVNIRKKEYDSFYKGTCNNVIWPLFHYFPNKIHYNNDDWKSYESVNQKFSQKILEIVRPGDQIWVHDYQLMLLPALLRHGNPDLSIAYFHHIPFPSADLFRILSSRSEILRGLLGADIIGFHTYDYVRHFLNCVNRILGNHSHIDEILHEGRRIKVVANPLGVDVRMIPNKSEGIKLNKEVKSLYDQIGDRKVILGIDRLDYTKGIAERLIAFREFLKRYPEYIGKVTFIQISVPTRMELKSYCQLRQEVERIVGQINGEYGFPGYIPIQYFYRSFSKDEIINFYKIASIALVTPLRDGLNLVAKEYVAARDDNDGVLILSEMTGAASEMGEALLVNPYDVDSFAETIHKGVTMPASERGERMTVLRKRIVEHTNLVWKSTFIKSWEEIVEKNHKHSQPLSDHLQSQLINEIFSADRCFIFLGSDNTIIPHDEFHQLLKELSRKKNIEVTLMTDKTRNFCDSAFNGLRLNLVSENGALIQMNKDINNWHSFFNLEEFQSIEKDVLHLLQTYAQHLPGSYIERKQFSIVWHYWQSDLLLAKEKSKDLSALLGQLLENTPFIIYTENNKLEIRHLLATKSYVLEKIGRELGINNKDALITFGNDDSDEEMYKLYPKQNIGIHVGAPNLFAKYHLPSTQGAHIFLQNIIRHSS